MQLFKRPSCYNNNKNCKQVLKHSLSIIFHHYFYGLIVSSFFLDLSSFGSLLAQKPSQKVGGRFGPRFSSSRSTKCFLAHQDTQLAIQKTGPSYPPQRVSLASQGIRHRTGRLCPLPSSPVNLSCQHWRHVPVLGLSDYCPSVCLDDASRPGPLTTPTCFVGAGIAFFNAWLPQHP